MAADAWTQSDSAAVVTAEGVLVALKAEATGTSWDEVELVWSVTNRTPERHVYYNVFGNWDPMYFRVKGKYGETFPLSEKGRKHILGDLQRGDSSHWDNILAPGEAVTKRWRLTECFDIPDPSGVEISASWAPGLHSRPWIGPVLRLQMPANADQVPKTSAELGSPVPQHDSRRVEGRPLAELRTEAYLRNPEDFGIPKPPPLHITRLGWSLIALLVVIGAMALSLKNANGSAVIPPQC